jgi:AcrR family transcriptional regulator
VTIGTRPPGLRERKRRATRRALQEAALRLVSERGLEAVTVEEISDAVEVSSRTFFNYFPTKEDALAGEQSWLPDPDEVRRILIDDPGPTLLGDVHRVLVAAVPNFAGRRDEVRLRAQLVERYPVLLRAALAAFLADEQTLQDILARRVGLSAQHAGVPRLVAVTTTAVLRVAIDRWMQDEPGNEEQLTRRIDDAFAQLRDLVIPDVPAVAG